MTISNSYNGLTSGFHLPITSLLTNTSPYRMANLYTTNPFFLELQYHGNQKILDFQTLCIPSTHCCS